MVTAGDRPLTRLKRKARYHSQTRELYEIATSQFGLPEAVAQELVRDVMLSSLLRIGSSDLRSWLRGAVVCAARRYKEGS
jgi:hypothetical protein